jgi:hypothetical protein
MQANISLSAMDTLNALDEGSVFNVTHCYARELISAGLALDDAGRLRITELGRLTVRHASRSYATADEHHANLDRFATPIDSHPDVSKPGRRDYCPDSDRTADWPPIDRSPNTWWKNTSSRPRETPSCDWSACLGPCAGDPCGRHCERAACARPLGSCVLDGGFHGRLRELAL